MRHAWIAFALVGCASSDPIPPPDVALSVGQENNAWVDAQAKHLKVDLVQVPDGTRTPLIDAGLPPPAVVNDTTPPTFIQFPEQHFSQSIVASFEATGIDKDGKPVLRGHSIYYGMSSIFAVRIPIFIGRVQNWARPLSQLGKPHLRPVVTTMYELLIAAGGDPIAGQDLAVPDFFDAAAWQAVGSQPPLPRAPKSVASIGTRLVMVDDTGASWLDLQTDEPGKLDVPSLDFSQIAGGQTLEQPGSRFIVGATRQEGAPTDKVLFLDSTLKPTVFTLSVPRLGAAATFVGTTLVVAGGSATGAGVEVLPKDATAFMPLSYPPDATAGLGMAPLDDKTALVVGGLDPATAAPPPLRTVDVTCAATCAATEVGAAMQLARTKVFVLGSSQILIVGETDQAEGMAVDHVFSIDPSQPPPFVAAELQLPDARRRAQATAALLPNGQVALVGGHLLDPMQSPATSLEIFIQ